MLAIGVLCTDTRKLQFVTEPLGANEVGQGASLYFLVF